MQSIVDADGVRVSAFRWVMFLPTPVNFGTLAPWHPPFPFPVRNTEYLAPVRSAFHASGKPKFIDDLVFSTAFLTCVGDEHPAWRLGSRLSPAAQKYF